jgi:hypothetical protein
MNWEAYTDLYSGSAGSSLLNIHHQSLLTLGMIKVLL